MSDEKLFICDHADRCNTSPRDCSHKIPHCWFDECEELYCADIAENVYCVEYHGNLMLHSIAVPKVEVTRDDLEMLAQVVVDVVLKKNADYGDAWQRDAIPGVMSRLKDKICRIEVLADGRQALVEGEGLEDACIDAIGYSLLGLLYMQETRGLSKLAEYPESQSIL